MPDPVAALHSMSTRRMLDEPLRVCVDTMLDSFGAYEAMRNEQGTICDFEIVHVNASACADLGVPREDQVGHRLCEVFPTVRASGYFERYCAVVNGGEPLIEDASERDGRFFDLRVSKLGDGFVASWREVTSRKTLEFELRTSSEMLRAVVQASAAAIFIKDTSGRYLLVNPVAENVLGLHDQVLGRTDAELLNAQLAAQVQAADREVLDTGRTVTSEDLVETEEKTITFLSVKTPLRNERGEIYGLCGVATDISSRIRTEEALRSSEERERARAEELSVLMDATPAAVWIARDPECHDIRGSRAAYEMLRMATTDNMSLTPDAPASAPTHFVVKANGVEMRRGDLPVQRAARGEEVRNFEEEIVFSDGDRLWLYGSAIPLRRADGTPRGAIAAFLDITAYKRIEQELRLAGEERERLLASEQEARAAAEAASRAKDRFLATVSHELRTPLGAVLGYVQMLQNGAVALSRHSDVLEVIRRNANLQLQLIDDMLDLSRIAHGKFELTVQTVAVDAILSNAVDAILPAASAKALTVTRELATAAIVSGDPARLHQVFSNVLTNAVKFTSTEGRIHVALRESGTMFEILVKDDGLGIDPAFLPHVFEQFTQAGKPAGRNRGLGLGLSIAQHLVTRHGGTITAESEGIGKGATFRIRLPRA
jgi:PAS domain S-box-containing protein